MDEHLKFYHKNFENSFKSGFCGILSLYKFMNLAKFANFGLFCSSPLHLKLPQIPLFGQIYEIPTVELLNSDSNCIFQKLVCSGGTNFTEHFLNIFRPCSFVILHFIKTNPGFPLKCGTTHIDIG